MKPESTSRKFEPEASHQRKKTQISWLRVIGLRGAAAVAMMLIAIALTVKPIKAQNPGWTEPVLIFESQGNVSSPSINVDEYGQVHAFWVYTPDPSPDVTGNEIYYARLDRADLQPIDVLVVQKSVVSMLSAVNRDEAALIWNGGTFSWGGFPFLSSARSWAAPEAIDQAYPTSSLAVAPDNSIWAILGDEETNAVFVQRLDPDTHLWEPRQFVANASTTSAAPNATRIAFSSDTLLHAVWTEYQLPNGWPPTGVFYSRSNDGGQNWSAPTQLANGNYNQPFVAVGPGQEVYVAWNGIAGVGGKYFIQSADGGLSWSGTTAVLAPGTGGGSSGPPNLTVDSEGTVHMLVSNETCVIYASLEPTGWTDPDCISRGVPSTHTEFPVMTLGLGNQLHVLFWTNDKQLWYMKRELAVPGVQPLPTPTAVIPTDVPPTTAPTLAPTATHLPDYGPVMQTELTTRSGISTIIVSIVPVVILFFAVYLIRFRRH